jgi:hypothetical protein
MRLGASLLAAVAFTVSMAASAEASPMLVGDTITFVLNHTGFGDFTDIKTISAEGDGINEGDGSNIGGDGAGPNTNPMAPGEFIHVFNTSIQFSLYAGGVDVPGFPGYKTTGFGSGAVYILLGLFDPGVAEITGVTIGLSDVVNVGLGSEVFFDPHSVALFVDDLGVLVTPDNLGLVTLNLTVRDLSQTTPVPEPGTLVLLGSGVAAAWIRRRRLSRSNARLT